MSVSAQTLATDQPLPHPAALEIRGVTAGYGETVVLRELDIVVPAGKVVALLGRNGVGKTTIMRLGAGLLRPTSGTVLIDGKDATRTAPHQRARAGLCLIPEGRGIFRDLTVAENLRLHIPPWEKSTTSIDPALEAFPKLGQRLHQLAGSMSGGEQQMLSLGRAFLSAPKIILLDEVSMGLSPVLVDEIFKALKILATSGAALLLVEQYVERALAFADIVILLDKGSVSYAGPPSGLDKDALLRSYLGTGVDPAIPAD